MTTNTKKKLKTENLSNVKLNTHQKKKGLKYDTTDITDVQVTHKKNKRRERDKKKTMKIIKDINMQMYSEE